MWFTRRTPRKMFGYPYAEVIASHRENVAELARLQPADPGAAPILTDKPAGWSWRAWARYIDDTADDLRTARDAAAEG